MRYLEQMIKKDLSKKMVFISGPRQCGKTTLVKHIISNEDAKSLYLNWDDLNDKKIIIKRQWNDEQQIIALDEIHKYSRWKNFIKGTYDTQKEIHKFIITGSARLDIYKKGQDSLMGRFFSWRLHPLCLSELKHQMGYSDTALMLERLLEFGGFPEPFFSNDSSFAKRWRNERVNLIFRQDIREIENIKDISILELFYFTLRERVGSEIKLSHIARDLEIAPKTAKSWLHLLEKTYTLFTITPYSKSLTKAIIKAPKVYFYDNGEVEGDLGAKLENLVANHLLKKIHYLQDSTGDRYDLHYIRDRQGHEVDFLLTKNRKPMHLIEVKTSDETHSPHLYYFMEKLNLHHATQLVMNTKNSISTKNKVTVIRAEDWLSRELGSE